MPGAFVYILSNKSHTLYTGFTTDLRRRFHEHLDGVYPGSFTARYHFDRLVYYEVLESLDQAMKRERQIKNMQRDQKVRLIQAMNPNWLDLSPRLNPLRLFE